MSRIRDRYFRWFRSEKIRSIRDSPPNQVYSSSWLYDYDLAWWIASAFTPHMPMSNLAKRRSDWPWKSISQASHADAKIADSTAKSTSNLVETPTGSKQYKSLYIGYCWFDARSWYFDRSRSCTQIWWWHPLAGYICFPGVRRCDITVQLLMSSILLVASQIWGSETIWLSLSAVYLAIPHF